MSRRRDLQEHRHSLDEIRNIMNSMKTLAYMETRKLSRFIGAQHTVVNSIEEVAADFLSFHASDLSDSGETTPVYLLLGSERGFCGDFNQRLLQQLEASLESPSAMPPLLMIIGHKMQTLLQDDKRVFAMLKGASVVEEVSTVLDQLVNELLALQQQHGKISLYAVYHCGEEGTAIQKLLPPFPHYLHQKAHFSLPPLLNVPPAEFLLDLTDQYLFAALHEILYTSLLAENHQRVIHLEGAVKHLDSESAELTHRANALRQEEIIEEIEVILLSSTTLKA